MAPTWHHFHSVLVRSSNSLDFQRKFQDLRERQQKLARFRDQVQLLEYLHHSRDTAGGKNGILAGLVQAAQDGDLASDCALTLMLLALWPGIDAVHRRTRARRLLAPGELAAEVLVRAVEAIRTLDLARVEWIAATILKNIERDMMRAHQREIGRERQHLVLDEVASALIATRIPERSREHLQDEIVGLIGSDGTIVMRVAVDGCTQAEVATEFGLSAVAARKRYQRASCRLRDIFQDCQ